MSTFKTEKQKNGQKLLVRLIGELDANTAVKAHQELEGVNTLCDITSLILDCAALSYISSAGIGVLLSLQLLCKEKNVQLSLCHVPPHILNVLEIIGLDKKIHVLHTDVELHHLLENNPL
ncbi:STAS domain-containing protein [Pontibacter sp. SGAir0037]|uniref:STAS domain-containing protein n=1 Tax=Pontibacter sp. SGAir0037 TaxID=2571030 RepID=UPI0010CCEF12|nr:STAS domain-containing protein [Pontibacter sp. SGAir0037]QCR22099.1 hypothetical protein C1N53_06920 [Pontibacter sp. SGAir0037]